MVGIKNTAWLFPAGGIYVVYLGKLQFGSDKSW